MAALPHATYDTPNIVQSNDFRPVIIFSYDIR